MHKRGTHACVGNSIAEQLKLMRQSITHMCKDQVSVERRGSNRDVGWNGEGLQSQPEPILDQKCCEVPDAGGGDDTVLGPVRGDYRGEMRR